METAIYKIEALTNMHVGSGDANYGVIDNLVQRDVTNNLPTINGSSLKGALREYFVSEDYNKLNDVFGHDDGNADYRFLSANLLAIPMRSNKKEYFLATCPMVIAQFNENAKNFGSDANLDTFKDLNPATGKPIIFIDFNRSLLIEGFGGENDSFEKKTKPENCSILGDCENLIILSNEDFITQCNDFNLPVIARNKVGENLWYEQVVPSKSRFYFTLLYIEKNFDTFNEIVEEGTIHIGANATVGYGFTKISKI